MIFLSYRILYGTINRHNILLTASALAIILLTIVITICFIHPELSKLWAFPDGFLRVYLVLYITLSRPRTFIKNCRMIIISILFEFNFAICYPQKKNSSYTQPWRFLFFNIIYEVFRIPFCYSNFLYETSQSRVGYFRSLNLKLSILYCLRWYVFDHSLLVKIVITRRSRNAICSLVPTSIFQYLMTAFYYY